MRVVLIIAALLLVAVSAAAVVSDAEPIRQYLPQVTLALAILVLIGVPWHLLSRQPWLQSRACAARLREACRARRSHRLCRDRCRRCRRGRPPSWRELHRGRRCSALCRSLRRCRARTLSSSHFENLIWPLPISGRRRASFRDVASRRVASGERRAVCARR